MRRPATANADDKPPPEVGALQARIEELTTELREARDREAAIAEVLGVINSSPGDLVPVFDAMLEKATRLCDAPFAIFWTYDGEDFRPAAFRVPEAFAGFLRDHSGVFPSRSLDAVTQGTAYVHNLDLAEINLGSTNPLSRAVVDLGGARTGLLVPLANEGELLGAIRIFRQEVRPFTDNQIGLLQNFAAQAVIAMENARLITETREALERQTATADVLEIISSSPGRLEPVFEAVLANAVRICGGSFGMLALRDGDGFRGVATVGVSRELSDGLSRVHQPPPGTGLHRLQETAQTIQIADCAAEPAYDRVRKIVPLFNNVRTALHVPMLKDDQLLGAILIYRDEVLPFGPNEVDLVENFAKQAVIAIENARLIAETREALDQQTATAEVLGVINSSPGDLAPVFDAMLVKARHLCEAELGILLIYDGDCFRTVSLHGAPEAYVEFVTREPLRPGPHTGLARLVRERRLVHISDLAADVAYRERDPLRVASVELAGMRTFLAMPLLKDEALLGVFVIYRSEVRPFSDKQITLLQNFAAQAVIAIENARLLNEIRQRQAELRVTFDNMADGVAMFDEDLRLAAWNRNFQQIADFPEDILARRPSYSDYLRTLTKRGELDILSVDTELSHRVEDTEQELRLERTRPNGQVIEVRRNAVPDGGFVLIYSDITERKRSEAEIRAARDAAEAALGDLKAAQANLVQAEKMASLGQLTAGIAHEIKNPLNFVNNFAGLSVELLDELKETTAPAIAALDDNKRAEIDETMVMLTSNLEKIAEHGRRADGIVKSMLEHSRGGTGERRAVDLNGLVEEALNLAYHGGRAQDQSFNITLERDYARDLAPIDLVPQDITRVCLNLFGNGFYAATKRGREGGDPKFKPTLKVSTQDLGDAVEIRTRDNGIGIPAEIKDKLFQPFFTTKPTGEGTGLGLSISYDIVTQQHGGTIEVDSRVGQFTEFTVRLPRKATTSGTAA
jgi:two-component system NtrC family sensor kinase